MFVSSSDLEGREKTPAETHEVPFDMVFKILQPFQISSENFEMSLVEIKWYPSSLRFNGEIAIMCDAVECSQVGLKLSPLLGIVDKPKSVVNRMYMPLSRNILDSLRIYIRKADGFEHLPREFREKVKSFRFVLHIRMKGSRS